MVGESQVIGFFACILIHHVCFSAFDDHAQFLNRLFYFFCLCVEIGRGAVDFPGVVGAPLSSFIHF